VLELTIFLPFTLLMSLALWRSGAWERRVIEEELAAEAGAAVSPAEYERILRDRMFRTRRIDRLHPALSAAIVNAQNELAFRERRVRDEGREPERDRLIAAWREEIRLLRELERQRVSAMSLAMAAPSARSSTAPNACWRKWPLRSISSRLGVPCMP
jgi:hypothetical protein